MTYRRLEDVLLSLNSTKQLIARKETPGPLRPYSSYVIFNTPGDYLDAIVTGGNNVTFHEITKTATNPYPSAQKLYFDIDASSDLWGPLSSGAYEKSILRELFCAVQSEFEERVTTVAPLDEPLVASSTDYEKKVSLHVIFPNVLFREHSALKRAALRIIMRMAPLFAKSIDILYKKNQGLRILYSTKLGTSRTKLPVSGPWSADPATNVAMSTIHTYSNEKANVLDDYFPDIASGEMFGGGLSDADENAMVKTALAALAHKERSLAAKKGLTAPPVEGAYDCRSVERTRRGAFRLSLLRKSTSGCVVCNRDHEHENCTVYVDNGRYTLYCFRSNGEKNNGRVIHMKKSDEPKVEMVPLNTISWDDVVAEKMTLSPSVDSGYGCSTSRSSNGSDRGLGGEISKIFSTVVTAPGDDREFFTDEFETYAVSAQSQFDEPVLELFTYDKFAPARKTNTTIGRQMVELFTD